MSKAPMRPWYVVAYHTDGTQHAYVVAARTERGARMAAHRAIASGALSIASVGELKYSHAWRVHGRFDHVKPSPAVVSKVAR